MNLQTSLWIAAVFAAALGSSSPALAQPSGSDYKRYLTSEVTPEYPEAARQQHLSGSGVVALQINGDGKVTSATVLKTTGHAILDNAALKACRRFRFVPSSIARADVPVAFNSSGAWFPAPDEDATSVALFTPMVPPSWLVTSAHMQTSTGNPTLDNIALKNIRQWRFKPGRVSEGKVAIRFPGGADISTGFTGLKP